MKDDVTSNLADGFRYRQQDHIKCQHEGCMESGEIPCWIDDMDKPDYFYCAEHAGEEGFCHCCGTFIAGWIDFGTLCDNCREELE